VKYAVNLKGMLVVLAATALVFAAETGDEQRRPRENDHTQSREQDRVRPPEVKQLQPGEAQPGLRPPQVRNAGPSAEPRREPRAPANEGQRVVNLPNTEATPVAAPPNPPLNPPAEGYQNNAPNYRYGGRGDYGRTFHGEHDRWRYDRFHGSWDFLIFPGPVIYAPPLAYGSGVVTSHVAGVYVEYSGEDATGSDFAAAISDRLREGDMGPTASASGAALELYIISMDEDPSDPGYGSAVSVSYVLMPENRFITAQLLDVGTEQIDPLAASVVSYAAQLLDEYR